MKRKYIFYYIRFFACLCVIGIHCTVSWDYNYLEYKGIVRQLFHNFFRIGLPIFYILSGALLLNSQKEETVGSFYLKRTEKIVIPFLIYGLFYATWVHMGFQIKDAISLNIWKQLINELPFAFCRTIETYQSVHLWFMYSIIGIYLLVPFLKVMMQNLNEEKQKALFWLLILMRGLYTYVPIVFGININIEYTWNGWILYLMIGYMLVQPWIKKYYNYLIVFGGIAYAFSIFLQIFYPNFSSSNKYDLDPLMIMQACGICVFFLKHDKTICKNVHINKVISFLSNYCFSVYLIHEYVRSCIEDSGWWMSIPNYMTIKKLLLTLVVFCISLLISIIVDHTFVWVVQKCFSYFVSKVKYLINAIGGVING